MGQVAEVRNELEKEDDAAHAQLGDVYGRVDVLGARGQALAAHKLYGVRVGLFDRVHLLSLDLGHHVFVVVVVSIVVASTV